MSTEFTIKVVVFHPQKAPALLAALAEVLDDRDTLDEVTITLTRSLMTGRSDRKVKDKIELGPHADPLTEEEAAELLDVRRPLPTPIESYIRKMDAEDTHAQQ
ncbi:MAG TPA: hypothetical protein PKC19_23855 [Roseiflexaceae bacterium]|nr:hypothetical protein [Roseiflexaceae bacterium]